MDKHYSCIKLSREIHGIRVVVEMLPGLLGEFLGGRQNTCIEELIKFYPNGLLETLEHLIFPP